MRGGISVFGDYSEEGEEGEEEAGVRDEGSQCRGFLRENFRLARSIFFVARHVSRRFQKKSLEHDGVFLHTTYLTHEKVILNSNSRLRYHLSTPPQPLLHPAPPDDSGRFTPIELRQYILRSFDMH